jgi:hypothetical protein
LADRENEGLIRMSGEKSAKDCDADRGDNAKKMRMKADGGECSGVVEFVIGRSR